MVAIKSAYMNKINKREHDIRAASDDLIENAFYFIASAIDSVPSSARHTILDLHTSIELFFKARLMFEHWSLVLDKPGDVSFEKFISGDFKSIYLTQAIKRIDHITDEKISKDTIDAFKSLSIHRNRIAHFSSVEAANKDSESIGELWACWFHMNTLLMGTWANYFDTYAEEIKNLDEKLKKHICYLKEVFNNNKSEIDIELKKGNKVENCNACSFMSLIIDMNTEAPSAGVWKPANTWGGVRNTKCLVCGLESRIYAPE